MSINNAMAVPEGANEQVERCRQRMEELLRKGALKPPDRNPLSQDEESAIDDLRFLCVQSQQREFLINDLRSLMKKHAKILLEQEK